MSSWTEWPTEGESPVYLREDVMPVSPTLELIAQERHRQMTEEGWDSSHDDSHNKNQLAMAAVCYALPPENRDMTIMERSLRSYFWPWLSSWWKPKPEDRVRELTKAGALIAAEIDRLLRKSRAESTDG
jgi:hypothetical protein